MAKRFVDTGRFFDPWYRSLSPTFKVFWEFVISSCDIAGAWKKDFALAGFAIGATPETISPERTLEVLNAGKIRIVEFGDYWFVVDFIGFQYGALSADCRPHKAVFLCLQAHIARGLPKKYVQNVRGNIGEDTEKRWQKPPAAFRRAINKLGGPKR